MDDVEYVLTQIPLILERIFSFLPVRDLLRSQSVCKSWKSASKNVLQKRNEIPQVEYITYAQEWDDDARSVEFKRTNREIKWKRDSRMYREFSNWRNQWHCAPIAGICFTSANDRKNKNLNCDAENIVRHWLPPKSKLLVLNSFLSFVCVDNEKAETENRAEDIKSILNFISFPQSLSNTFSVNFFNLKSGHLSEDHDVFVRNIRTELEHCDTKLVFVCEPVGLYHDLSQPLAHSNVFTSAAQRGVVVIGCLFETSIVFNPDGLAANKSNSNQDIVVVTFKGKNLRSASVLVGSDVDTVQELTNCVKKLQDSVKLFSNDCPNECINRDRSGRCESCNSQMLGFMIACCARAVPNEWYVEEGTDDSVDVPRNLEQKTYRKMFPNVPLIGMYGMGEIGGSINLTDHNEHRDKLLGIHGDLLKSESTVFAVLMIK